MARDGARPRMLPWLLLAAASVVVARSAPPAFEAIPPSPQRHGDPNRGYRFLIGGDYVRSGPPLALVGRVAPELGADLRRSGDAARLPYYLSVSTAPNGVRVVTPNCLQCHARRIDGRLILGLGNVSRDYTLNLARGIRVVDQEIVAKFGRESPERAAFAPLRQTMLTVGPQIRTRVVGVNPADKLALVLAAHRDPETLEWRERPWIDLPDPSYVVPTDVPALWLLRKKHAMFYTGAGRGDFVRLMMAASLLTLRDRDEVREIEGGFVDLLAWIRTLEPPPWPGPLDHELAARGERVFVERCASCHGTYGEDGQYPNLLIGLEVVGTDRLLAEQQSTLLAPAIDAYNRSWFGRPPHAARLVPTGGYVAPPLDGVWATAPYLHNGAVPTLGALLDSRRRPAYWKRRRRADRYDLDQVGLRYKPRKWPANKHVYDTTLPGYGNAGHTFGDALDEDRRRALLEYLKTL